MVALLKVGVTAKRNPPKNRTTAARQVAIIANIAQPPSSQTHTGTEDLEVSFMNFIQPLD
jgi:hypothetical protein